MVRIAVRATKAIIRESARLVNLTLGRAGFFMLRRLLRGGRPLEQVGRLPRSAYHAIQKSRDGVVFAIANLHPSQPLTSGFFGLFRLRRRNKKLAFPVPSSPPAYPKNRFLKLHLPTFGTLRSRWLYDLLIPTRFSISSAISGKPSAFAHSAPYSAKPSISFP